MHLLSLNTKIITEVICDISGDKIAHQKPCKNGSNSFQKHENVWLEFFSN
jgi:hypothetical protein